MKALPGSAAYVDRYAKSVNKALECITRAPMDQDLAFEAIRLAAQHVTEGAMVSSAKLCHDDAIDHYNGAMYGYAIGRAVKSLAYSVGIFHPDHKRAIILEKSLNQSR